VLHHPVTLLCVIVAERIGRYIENLKI